MNTKFQFELAGQLSNGNVDSRKIRMELELTPSGASIHAIGEDGFFDADIYLELMDGKLDIHVWNREHVDGGDPIFSAALMEVANGESDQEWKNNNRPD